MSATPPPTRSPLFSLVLMIVCISAAGAFLAGLHYFAVDLPEQQNVQAPSNGCFLGICTGGSGGTVGETTRCPDSISFDSCAQYGESDCYQCITWGESANNCEIPGDEAVKICSGGYQQTCVDGPGGVQICT